MPEVNYRAMTIPAERLVTEIKDANERKKDILAQRDRKYGVDRPMIKSYMENITIPPLFGYNANEIYHNASLALDMELRAKLFWIDNSNDDDLANLEINTSAVYTNMTLFGLHIDYQPDGVPVFARHSLADNPDINQIKPFDFYKSGEMPMIHKRFNEMTRLSEDLYDGEVKLTFPVFYRGPLDIAIQLRGYENFMIDCSDDPAYVRSLLELIVSERLRYNNILSVAKLPPSRSHGTTIDDDWVNVPFITPRIFNDFVIPAYERIQANEGPVVGFHTCGVINPIIKSLLETFSGIKTLDVSGWNDIGELNSNVDKNIQFQISFINTFVLVSSSEEHKQKLNEVKKIARDRKISMIAQSIVKIFKTFDKSIYAMNRFIDLARRTMA